MEFCSERLYFREFNSDDYYLYSSIYSDDQVMKYAYTDRITNEEAMAEAFGKLLQSRCGKGRSYFEFAVFLRKNQEEFIGCAIILLDFHLSLVKHGEIGYYLLPKYWGRGYATEISAALTDFCFKELRVHKVVASCNANNTQSEKIMIKMGMIKEGELRKERYKNGEWVNELRYGILFDEWENR